MSYTVHFRPEAEKDIEEAATWYEMQRKDLGNEFLDEVQSICGTISDNPNMYPVVHRHTRRAVIHRFPFGIYYRVEGKSIIIISVMHGSRHPKQWKKRT